jgi:hypothetical protein
MLNGVPKVERPDDATSARQAGDDERVEPALKLTISADTQYGGKHEPSEAEEGRLHAFDLAAW